MVTDNNIGKTISHVTNAFIARQIYHSIFYSRLSYVLSKQSSLSADQFYFSRYAVQHRNDACQQLRRFKASASFEAKIIACLIVRLMLVDVLCSSLLSILSILVS